jgi:coenzyme PQQ precursor peptide PqqA
MVWHQNVFPVVEKHNSLEQCSTENSDSTASRVPIKNTTDWEQPDFEEVDICMEITAYIYHWQ